MSYSSVARSATAASRQQNRFQTTQQNNTTLPPQPIYITIGPPCAGKTTLLKQLVHVQQSNTTTTTASPNNTTILDITLDDQRDVYIPVPTRLFLVNRSMNTTLHNHNTSSTSSSSSTTTQAQQDTRLLLLQRRIQYKSLERRIYDGSDNAELRYVLQRLGGQLTAEAFRERMAGLYQNYTNNVRRKQQEKQSRRRTGGQMNPQRPVAARDTLDSTNESTDAPPPQSTTTTTTTNLTTEDETSSLQSHDNDDIYTQARNDLIEVVEEIIANDSLLTLPKTTDVFCVESLFRPHSSTNQTGLEAASGQLRKLAATRPHQAMAWGNTNTRPSDYKTAMEVAQRTGRPVQFVVYMDAAQDCRIVEDGDGNSHVLPKLSLKELLRRNVHRLLKTGKYIPAKSILESSQRVSNLVALAMRELERKSNITTPTKDNQTLRADAGSNGVPDKEEARSNDVAAVEEVPPVDEPAAVPARTFTKLELDMVLAKLINFDMQPNRTVRFVAPPGRKKRVESPRGGRNRGPRSQHMADSRSSRPNYSRPRSNMGSWQNSSPPKRWKEGNSPPEASSRGGRYAYGRGRDAYGRGYGRGNGPSRQTNYYARPPPPDRAYSQGVNEYGRVARPHPADSHQDRRWNGSNANRSSYNSHNRTRNGPEDR